MEKSREHQSSFGDNSSSGFDFGKRDYVAGVFDRVADKYDLMNDLMSMGVHRLWKEAMIRWLYVPNKLAKGREYRLIDVAGGTGDIAFGVADIADRRAKIVVCDINRNMLEIAKRRAHDRRLDNLEFVESDAEDLPHNDDSFDAYTIAFGIRNVDNKRRALEEAYRVLAPGGRFLCLEFSSLNVPVLGNLYRLYSDNIIPCLGRLVVGDAQPYHYLVESIRRFPNRARFAQMITEAGFERVSVRLLSGGIVALHSAWKI